MFKGNLPVYQNFIDLMEHLKALMGANSSTVFIKRLKKKTAECTAVVFRVDPGIVVTIPFKDDKWFKKFSETRIAFIRDTHRGDLEELESTLRNDQHSRRAYLLNFDFWWEDHDPCNMVYQFLWRDGFMDLLVYLRSSDLVNVLPLDLMAASTFLEEVVKRFSWHPDVKCKMGTIIFFVGSLHVYENDWKKFLEEESE